MSIKLQLPTLTELKPRITVIGVGGAGGNAVNNMIASGLTGVEFVVANTDAQALLTSGAEQRVQLGVNLTEGLGAGARPEIGEAAAEEAIDELRNQMSGSHMVFVACGMGGGTGTGAASVIARIAKDMDILTVGIVTKPFQFEGARRMRIAEAGIEELKNYVDTLIVIPNQNLFRIASEKTTFAEAFVLADQVLYSGIACIVDLIVREGLINLDFADVKAIMSGMGSAMMGTGEGEGERRAIIAAEEAISNPLLDGLTLKGARGLLLSIVGGPGLTLYEVDEAASRIRQEVDPDANIIVGASFDETLDERVRVSIVASGMEGAKGNAAGVAGPVADAPVIAGPEIAGKEAVATQQASAVPPPLPVPMRVDAAAGQEADARVSTPPAALAQPQVSDQAEMSAATSALDARAAAPPVATRQEASAFAGSPTAPQNTGVEYNRLLMQDAPQRDQPQDKPLQPERSLSEAAHQAGLQCSPQSAERQSAQRWQAPGDVTIEPALPQMSAIGKGLQPHGGQSTQRQPAAWQEPNAGAAEGTAPAAASPTPQQQPLSSFDPAPPADLGRRTRRMPTVEEFPTVGQRDYHAKTAAAAAPQPQSPTPRPQQAAATAQKMGFFERLTGRRGQAGATTTPTDSPSSAVADYPQDRQGRSGATDRAAGNRPAAGHAKRSNDPIESAQDVDLPLFFNKGRR